jgi:hypothetical protein
VTSLGFGLRERQFISKTTVTHCGATVEENSKVRNLWIEKCLFIKHLDLKDTFSLLNQKAGTMLGSGVNLCLRVTQEVIRLPICGNLGAAIEVDLKSGTCYCRSY